MSKRKATTLLPKPASAVSLSAGIPSSSSSSSSSSSAAASSSSSMKKRKTTASAAAAAVAVPIEVDRSDVDNDEDDMEKLGMLESSILGDEPSSSSSAVSLSLHFNSLVQLQTIADKLRRSSSSSSSSNANADQMAVGMSAVQACVRVYTEWLASGQFLNSRTASKKKQKSATLQALQSLISQQYKKLWSLLTYLLQSPLPALQLNSLHACMDLVQAEGSSLASISSSPTSSLVESLSNGSFAVVLKCIFLSPRVLPATRTEFHSVFVSPHADLRTNVLVQVRAMSHLTQESFAELANDYAPSSSSASSSSVGVQHIVAYLIGLDWQTVLHKNWIVMPDVEFDESDMNAVPTTSSGTPAAALQKLYGDAWMGVLKHKLTVELYKEILVQLHSVIIPCVVSPMLLADFLTDSYNIGGVVSLLALNGLFILISKYNLDYPSFFKKLYACCKPYVFHAKYRARFFQLVSLFLTSSYLPSYLVCAFTKRFARLSLTAPPAGAIFCVALIYNLLRRHPVCRPLINRSLAATAAASQAARVVKGESAASTAVIDAAPAAPVNGGILSSLAALLGARQKAVADGTLLDPLSDVDANNSLRLTLPVYHSPLASQSVSIGSDPYLYEEDAPELSRASDSSLWEVESLTHHVSPTVSNLAKVFFTSHAPKKDLEMSKYIQQSYETLFTKETERRVNQKVALQQQFKFAGLFADATESIGLTFKLDDVMMTDVSK